MILHSPMFISSRLLPAINVGGAEISLENTGLRDMENRQLWRWYVDYDGVEYSADDLKTGCGARASTIAMFETLFSFLSEFGEAQDYPESDCRNLFPDGLAEWAQRNADELGMYQVEMEECPTQFIEE